MTQPLRANARNERARDLVDVLLLKESPDDLTELRRVCVNVFETRGTHTWPPHLEVHEHWRDEFARLASDYGLIVESLDSGVRAARDFIVRIDRAGQ